MTDGIRHISVEIVADKKLKGGAKWLYLYLAAIAKDDGVVYIKMKDLIEKTGLSESTIKSARKELINLGMIEYTPNSGCGAFSEYVVKD